MISIIIPNYNGNKYLKECLDAIYATQELPFEIILIDNASTDSDYKWLESYDTIKFKRLEQNYGFSKAVNEGIKCANGEYVLLLNNDTVMCEGFIEALVATMNQSPTIFAVCSKMLQYHHKELIDDAGDEYNLLGWAYKRGDGKSKEEYVKEEEVFSSCAGAALYRKEIFQEIGYFDENFFAYMEDVDISYRARIHGYKNIYCPKAEIYHIGSATSGSKYNAFKVRLAARNNVYVPYKNMPLFQLILNSPFLLLGYLIKYLFFAKKGFSKEYKEGFIEGIKKAKNLDKVKFKWCHLMHCIEIEGWLIKNVISYAWSKLRKECLKDKNKR